MGAFCAECKQGYYEERGYCEACSAVAQKRAGQVNSFFNYLSTIVVAFFPFYLLMGMRSIFLQIGPLLSVSGSLGPSLGDTPVARATAFIWKMLSLTNVDAQTQYPGCGARSSTFVSTYWQNFGMLRNYALPSVSIALAGACLTVLYKRVRKANFSSSSSNYCNQDWWIRRFVAAIMLWIDLLWLTLVKLSIEAVSCVWVGGEEPRLVLLTNNGQSCFNSEHTLIFMNSIFVLVLCLVVQPIMLVRILQQHISKNNHRQPTCLLKFGVSHSGNNISPMFLIISDP